MKNKKFWNWKNRKTQNQTDTEAEERILELHGTIAEESWFDDDVTPQLFKDELNAGNGDITVWINSPGGDCVAAAQIYNMLTNYKGNVTVKIDGIAASAASVIAMAGNKVLMSPVSMMMIHNPDLMLFGYMTDEGEKDVVDIRLGEKLPQNILDALVDDKVIKWAFNAQFERVCLSRYLSDLGVHFDGEYLDPSAWRCTMIWSATLGLPLSLEGVGAVLGLEKQKMTEGKSLIKYFCVPCLPTKINGGIISCRERRICVI